MVCFIMYATVNLVNWLSVICHDVRLETGEMMEQYVYRTFSYDENGEELLVEFYAYNN